MDDNENKEEKIEIQESPVESCESVAADTKAEKVTLFSRLRKFKLSSLRIDISEIVSDFQENSKMLLHRLSIICPIYTNVRQVFVQSAFADCRLTICPGQCPDPMRARCAGNRYPIFYARYRYPVQWLPLEGKLSRRFAP